MSRWTHKWWTDFPFDSFGLNGDQKTIERMDETMDYMLTHLEMMESQQMIYGLYDSAMSTKDWVESYLTANSISDESDDLYVASIKTLHKLGWVIALNEDGTEIREWTFRSRTAEVARLLTKLRQRFDFHAYSYQSKALVGNVKFDVRPRVVPRRDIPLDRMFENISNHNHEWIVQILTKLLVNRDKHNSGEPFQVSGFQMRSFQTIVQQYLQPKSKSAGVVVSAGTGSGKTLSFFIPALFQILTEKYNEGRQGVKVLSLYPRTRLANNQLQEYVSLILKLNKLLQGCGKTPITVGLEGQFTPTQVLLRKAMLNELELREWVRKVDDRTGEVWLVCPWMPCECGKGQLIVKQSSLERPLFHCSHEQCTFDYSFLSVTKDQLKQSPPDILLGVTESISKRLMASDAQSLFGLGEQYTAPSLIMLDEIHLQSSISGMQTGYFLRRLIHRIQRHRSEQGVRQGVQVVGLSATIGEPIRFFHELTGIRESDVGLVSPMEDEMRTYGAEYYYFVQADRKGEASMLAVLIQSTMCLIHNMHPNVTERDRYKAFGFVNSRDIAYRWEGDMRDAEHNLKLFQLRSPNFIQGRGKKYLGLPPGDCNKCQSKPQLGCTYYQHGECWWPMHSGRRLNQSLSMKAVTSLGGGGLDDLDLIISTSTLEVGYDDPDLMTVIQHQAPMDISGFVQRKGRGGRQAGTRPVMMTVLSPHASMDQYYFNNTHILTDPVFQKMPLNPQNYLVQRVHGFYAIMDYLAYRGALEGHSFDVDSIQQKSLDHIMVTLQSDNQKSELKRYVEGSLGISIETLHRVLTEKDGIFTNGLPQFLSKAHMALQNSTKYTKLHTLMNHYVPQNLFSDIQLPEVKILYPGQKDNDRSFERMEMALQDAVPGRVSFRWQKALWIVPNGDISPLDPDLLIMNPEEFITFLEAEQPVTIPVRKLPIPHQEILKGGFASVEHLQILQPTSITYKEFDGRAQETQSGMQSMWEFDQEKQVVTVAATPNKEKMVDRRSDTQGLSSYHMEWPDIAPINNSRVYGFLYNALRCVKFAENRPGSEYLKVQKVYAGYQLGLRYGKDQERNYTISYQDGKGKPIVLGYHLETEAICFEFKEESLMMDYSKELENNLRWKYFKTLVGNRLPIACGVPARTLFLLLNALSLSAALRQSSQSTPLELVDGKDLEHWEYVVLDRLGVAEYIQDELLLLKDKANLWGLLREVALDTQSQPMDTIVRDPLMLTLAQVLKKASQMVTGVEIKGDLASHVPLRMYYGDAAKPVISLFELGMKGTGVIKSLRYIMDNQPEMFWNQVEHEAFHCDQGDEEQVVKALLGLPKLELGDIAKLVQNMIQQTTIIGRNAAIEKLTDKLRKRYGFILQPNMIRILRSVCALSPEADLLDQHQLLGGVENWMLYQELHQFVFQMEQAAGCELEPEVLVEMFIEQLHSGSAGYDQWVQMKGFIEYHATHSATNMETVKNNVEASDKPLYKKVFSVLTKVEVNEYVDMPEEQCKELLKKRFQIPQEWVNRFYASAFAKENGYSFAYLYWAFTHNEVHEESVQIIQLQTRYRLKESIRSRLLRTCLDGCPSCLHTSTDIVPRWMLPQAVSQRLIRNFLQQLWCKDGMLLDLREDESLSERQVIRKINQFFQHGTHYQMRIWHVPSQIDPIHKAIGKLIADGVKFVSGITYGLTIAGAYVRNYDLHSGPTQELVLSLQEALDK